MNNLKGIIQLTELCSINDISLTINESGIMFTMYRNGKAFSKHFDIDVLKNIALNISPEILIDIFKEEYFLTKAA